MALQQIANYRQDHDAYNRELEEYQRKDAAYRTALAINDSDPTLKEKFEELTAMRSRLESHRGQLNQIRDELVNARTNALQKISP
jgi:hypothetical protein